MSGVTHDWTCPHCCDAEVAYDQAEEWLVCPGCGHAYRIEDLDRINQKAAKQAEHSEIVACFLADQRRGQKGGGSRSGKSYGKDDKLKAKRLTPLVDDSVTSTARQTLSSRDCVVRVPGLDCSTEEARAAISSLLGVDSLTT